MQFFFMKNKNKRVRKREEAARRAEADAIL
jgi:hypothetical protein